MSRKFVSTNKVKFIYFIIKWIPGFLPNTTVTRLAFKHTFLNRRERSRITVKKKDMPRPSTMGLKI